MLALFATIFIASLLGSLHCAGMCGAFVAIAVGADRSSALRTQIAYNGGRLLTYTILGAIAGGVGQLIDLAGALAGLQPIALLLAAFTTIAFGVVTYLHHRGVRVALFHPPAFLAKFASRVHRVAFQLSPTKRAAIIGLSTTLLPCGWLYAFAAVAAGTASPFIGAAVMVAFWFGTLPMMATIGAGARGAFGIAAAKLPLVTCAALVTIGLYTVVARAHLQPATLLKSIESKNASVETVGETAPSCCSKEGTNGH